jgi:hypothetical protein
MELVPVRRRGRAAPYNAISRLSLARLYQQIPIVADEVLTDAVSPEQTGLYRFSPR